MRDAVRGRAISGNHDGIAGAGPVARFDPRSVGHGDPLDYWRSPQGLENITPAGKLWPEGEGFPEFLRGVVEGAPIGAASVLEFGCGIGRLARCFDPDRYIGVDISPRAVLAAFRAHPAYSFTIIGTTSPMPRADVTLAHTVLLHVPDEALKAVVERFESPRVIVSEILGRQWRRAGNPPVFNREMSDYEAAFAPRYRLAARHSRPYPHYRDTNLTVTEFARC